MTAGMTAGMSAGMVLAIALLAGIGAPARYVVDRWVTDRAARLPWAPFPWGLLVVNASGSLIAGLVLALASGTAQTVLLVGLCGAFTTFSGFGWDLTRLWGQARAIFWATLGAMPAACLAAFLIGWGSGHMLASECLR